jgi:hypothetical protein
MGRPEEPLKLDGSPEREFAFWLRDLRNRAGLTYEALARATNYSTSTMQAAAAGRQLPTFKVIMAFVQVCGGDELLWKSYWREVKRALDDDSPYGVGGPVRPPWAPRHPVPVEPPMAGPFPAPAGAGAGETAPGPMGAEKPLAAAVPLPPVPAAARTAESDGWYVESFNASLRLDTPQPEAIEDRVIMATADEVRELATSISVPRHHEDSSPAHELSSELVFGGSLQVSDHPYESYFRYVIALATPLRAGERHKYRLRFRVPPGQPMAPHYVYMPFHRTDHFELHVRFDPQRLPANVWALSGTPPVVLYEDQPDGEILTPDRFGEIQVEFRDLRLGLGYGVHWQE